MGRQRQSRWSNGEVLLVSVLLVVLAVVLVTVCWPVDEPDELEATGAEEVRTARLPSTLARGRPGPGRVPGPVTADRRGRLAVAPLDDHGQRVVGYTVACTTGRTVRPGTGSSRQLAAMVASATASATASSGRAKVSPMHCLVPPPKGR